MGLRPLPRSVQTVTDRTSNPFGLRPPFDRTGADDRTAVFGYGDANADFHVIGDYPGVHGGKRTGVPFTETEAGLAIQTALRDVDRDFATGPREQPELDNCYWSYLHMCCVPDGHRPTEQEYADLERYFDAELRAINAHILLPVGERATDHVLREYTTQRRRVDLDMPALHASDLRGRGFMVIPIRNPREWEDGDQAALVDKLTAVLESDYRQTKGVATRVG
ncbi:uracil-DNA glycosylase family protein [Natrialba sp. PRR66]|uniref:uracil-DNA glycosylase family protein n=1 Tax=Natrialba sp. PRR66 TaxID=3098146 RepID=UPI002B1DF634|nr:uracil-DNA glycosylase family protein [Natrialba sp. PRR66]